MLFGNTDAFAIEVNDIHILEGIAFCQFRFWICGRPYGDWDDRIYLHTSAGYMREFCEYQMDRWEAIFQGLSADELLAETYDAYYDWDYLAQSINPNLRERFHLDEIGMTAVIDRYDIVLVGAPAFGARLIIRDGTRAEEIHDYRIPFGVVENVGTAYVEWARTVRPECSSGHTSK